MKRYKHHFYIFLFQFLDGTDIRGLDLSWLRAQYAVVSHRCFLPQYSIADNISYGNENRACTVTRREIEDAAYSAYAHEFIMGLPKVGRLFNMCRLPLSHMIQFTRFR